MVHGSQVVTHVDEKPPPWIVHDEAIFDIEKMEAFSERRDLERVSSQSREIVKRLTFQELANHLRKPLS